jgi:RHS repeat-associated protein
MQGAGGAGGLVGLQVGAAGPVELANTTHFACNDGNGNVMALVNAADGTESARYEYGPFGELLRATGPMALVNPLGFSTQYRDDVTGDWKYLHRDLDADTGRWPNRDPLGESGFMLVATGQQPAHTHDLDEDEPTTTSRSRHEPERLNLYGFVLNDPQNRVDPLGLISFDRCNDQQQAEIGAAWNSICQMVNDPKFQCCVGRSTFLQMFKRRCAWGNVKFKCRHNDEGLCPWVCAHAWQSLGIGRGVIVVCDHWADCGLSMKCLLAHEFSHVIGGDPTHGGITPKVEKCCTQQ